MKNEHCAWVTLFDDIFNHEKYIYHYTNVEIATKIIYNQSLKFSKINKTNDTLEAKPRIGNGVIDNKFIKQFKNLRENFLQLLCFSSDNFLKDEESDFKVSEIMKYSDYSGRGFALPRMWAQYADNSSGVCLIFDKEVLLSLIKKQLGDALIHCGRVCYKSQFQIYNSIDDFNEIAKVINEDIKNHRGKSIGSYFLKNHIDFVEYCYFTKLNDWYSEHEYRILAFDKNDLYIENIIDSLVGIVVGERMENSDFEILNYFANKYTDIKKINFSFNGCGLENMN